jgi:hypothetical protein
VRKPQELGRVTFGGRAIRLMRAGRGVTLLEIVGLKGGKETGVICGLRLAPEELDALADEVDRVATELEEAGPTDSTR